MNLLIQSLSTFSVICLVYPIAAMHTSGINSSVTNKTVQNKFTTKSSHISKIHKNDHYNDQSMNTGFNKTNEMHTNNKTLTSPGIKKISFGSIDWKRLKTIIENGKSSLKTMSGDYSFTTLKSIDTVVSLGETLIIIDNALDLIDLDLWNFTKNQSKKLLDNYTKSFYLPKFLKTFDWRIPLELMSDIVLTKVTDILRPIALKNRADIESTIEVMLLSGFKKSEIIAALGVVGLVPMDKFSHSKQKSIGDSRSFGDKYSYNINNDDLLMDDYLFKRLLNHQGVTIDRQHGLEYQENDNSDIDKYFNFGNGGYYDKTENRRHGYDHYNDGYGDTGSSSGTYEHEASYGGGGYGYTMSYLYDPFKGLAVLALLSLLAPLVYYVVSSHKSKRDVSFDLQLSDLTYIAESIDPIVALIDEHRYIEDYLPKELNHLWQLYKNNSTTDCYRWSLCHVSRDVQHQYSSSEVTLHQLILSAVTEKLLGIKSTGKWIDHFNYLTYNGEDLSCNKPKSCNDVFTND